jgi:predicted pyridoxine 5'-phosphate oxidase superfamily flavin-nucleotide-binding protein
VHVKNPFHAGELQIQELAGEAKIAERNAAMIADTIVPGALEFLRQQPLLVVGSNSARGELWASIIFGPKGFVESDEGKTLRIPLQPDTIDRGDPFWENISSDPRLGALAIDLASRRRLRINGRVIKNRPQLLTVAVEEAYPNCPKYIQRRFLMPGRDLRPARRPAEIGNAITDAVREMIETADTMFVASSSPNGGTDCSHRGGPPGFITIINEPTLKVPDYQGNSMFNTLGNIARNPATGILIVDFANRRTLQMTGKAHIHWHPATSAQANGNTGRSWMFDVERWRLRPLPVAHEWEFLDYSPFNPA